MEKYMNLGGRIMMAIIFVMAGFNKIGGYEGTQAYMDSMGVPGALLPLVIMLEAGGGIALILGFYTRWVALALAGFTLITGAIFHSDFSDQMQMIMFMKNLAMAGGLLVIAAWDTRETLSIDSRRLTANQAASH